MRNLGKVSLTYLHEIGVSSLAELKKFGSLPCYQMIRSLHPDRVSLNLLWALEGAIRDCDWRQLPEGVKKNLKARLEKNLA